MLDEISEEFKTQNSNAVSPIIKLTTTLRLLAEGAYQRGVGQDFNVGLAQQTVSKVFGETLDILEKKICSTG